MENALEIHAMDAICRRLYEVNFGRPQIATRELIKKFLEKASEGVKGNKSRLHFLQAEWEQIVDAWQLETWEAYRDVLRLGRKTRPPEHQRVVLWSIFDRMRSPTTNRHIRDTEHQNNP